MLTPIALLLRPRHAWHQAAPRLPRHWLAALPYPLMLAALPALAWFYGTTRVGWRIGGGEAIRLTAESALHIAALFYLAMVAAVVGVGGMIHWMARTYGTQSSVGQGIAIAGLTATPLFIAGLLGFYPLFALDLIVGLVALCHAVYLLYLGIPIAMAIPEERGFLFASAIAAVCLVAVIAIMGATVVLWDLGAAPVFVD